MGKKLRIKISTGIMCCIMVAMAGCSKNNYPDGTSMEPAERDNAIEEPQIMEEIQTFTEKTEPAGYGDTEEDLSLGNGDTGVTLEDVKYHFEDLNIPYFCLEVDDPIAQAIIADGWDGGFSSRVFIKGLVGYTPKSDLSGNLDGYTKDWDIIIEKNVGRGLLQSERLAEVKENILEMMIDIIRERGKNVGDYQEYFADEAMLQQIEIYLSTEIEEDWLLLESFYLSDYAGNAEKVSWYNKSETTWKDIENEITYRMAETEVSYNFAFYFNADYRMMGYGEDDEAAEIVFNCALSKETGLIDEFGISKWYLTRYDFETSRW